MPPRRSRSSVPNAVPKTVRSKFKKRSLDAYSAASKDIKEKRVPQNRLGEDIEDEPRHKRRRDEDDEDEDSDRNQQSRQKRRTSRPIAGAGDDVQYGSDSSGNEWTMGGLGEEDDDSELDSDEAFGDSDEERFEGFNFRGSSSGKAKAKAKKRKPSATTSRKTKALLDEDSGAEDDDDDGDSQDDAGEGLGDDAVDLAAMLDDDDDAVLGGNDHTREDLGEDSASGGSDDDSGEDEEEEESDDSESEEADEEDDAADEERVARMMDRLENLDSSRAPRQIPNTESTSDLTLEDLLSGVDAESRRQFEGEAKSKKKSSKATTISAPLPKRQQDRLDREVATQKAKEQLDRWRDTVIKNRRAEFLSFPMVDPNDQSKSLGKEQFIPASQGQPRTELEESIQRIMEESGLSNQRSDGTSAQLGSEESALLKSEELATNKLPLEEVVRRRAELRKARDLLFREEIKAKRIAKIKSKSYRRVHRKERERLAEQERLALQGLGGDDPMDDGDLETADRRRAEARMATKHKDSKWAKALKATNRTVWDDDARDSVIDQAKRNEELKRRIAGKDVRSDDDGELDSEEDNESDDNNETALQRLEDLGRENRPSEKGLSGLKFMRAAEERKRKANQEGIEQLRKELAIEAGEEEEDSEVESGGLGRAIFGPQTGAKVNGTNGIAKTQRMEFEAPEHSDDDDGGSDLKTGEDAAESTVRKPQGRQDSAPKGILKNAQRSNKPLARADHKGGQEDATDADGGKAAVSDWLSKPVKGAKQKQSSDAALDLALDVNMPTTDTVKAKAKPSTGNDARQTGQDAPGTDGWTTVKHQAAEDDDKSDSDSEEHLNPILSAQEQRKSLQQRAFAGDDVEIAFDAEKADIADSEDEKEVSNYLPGWGSWTGEGLSKSTRKANARARHNPLYKSKVDGVRQADRKDANLKNVIISEKQDRKGKKYLAPVLPHEYETKAQYERSRRLPMGPEWSTKEVHQRMTRPRVVVKPGVRIDALERPMV